MEGRRVADEQTGVAAEEGREGREFKPPYVSFTTFNNFLTTFGERPPPPQIDKTFLGSHSGANQALLLSTLKTFDLIDEAGRVMPKLPEIATDVDARKRFLDERLRTLYPGLVQLAHQNGTPQQLEDWFRKWGYQGSTMRKAVVFYLSAAQYAEVPVSPHFKAPKARPSSSTSRRKQTSSTSVAGVETLPERPPSNSDGTTYTFSIGEAGRVTVNVAVDVFKLTGDERDNLFGLIDLLRSFGSSDKASPNDQEGEDDAPAA